MALVGPMEVRVCQRCCGRREEACNGKDMPKHSYGSVRDMNVIHGLLQRAAQQARFVWAGPQGRHAVTRDAASLLPDSYRVPFVGRKILLEGDWRCDPALYQEVQAWIDEFWGTGQGTGLPAGCVRTDRPVRFGPRDRLDTPTAARKLILASVLHGPESTARSAMRFAQTDLLDVETIYLLRGPSIEKAIVLDEYCTLIPYGEAVQIRESLLEPPMPGETWPPKHAAGICALRTRGFEALDGKETKQYTSPLLREGHPEALALLLGVVWGDGYTVFGSWDLVPLVTSAALPFWTIGPIGGSFRRLTLLPLPMGQPYIKRRPLATQELGDLLDAHADLADQPRKIVNLAMRRLRDGAGRVAFEDKIIDICIALEALFTGSEWEADLRKTISSRGSWYYADTLQDRDSARQILKELYETRRNIIHGNTTDPVGHLPDMESSKLLADAENILRACLKSIVANGIPADWQASKEHKSIWRDPPRHRSRIPSIKSDSMSWTVKEQREIDQALEAVWKPEIDSTRWQPDAVPCIHTGINAEEVERCRQQGIPYVISVPIRLYMAHPRWPEQENDPVDERTKYYCGKDVEKHLHRWQEAAAAKKIHQFTLELEDPTMYLPKSFNMWRTILQKAGLP